MEKLNFDAPENISIQIVDKINTKQTINMFHALCNLY